MVEKPKPPSGKCFKGGATSETITATDYDLKTVDGTLRGVYGGDTNTSDKFKKAA